MHVRCHGVEDAQKVGHHAQEQIRLGRLPRAAPARVAAAPRPRVRERRARLLERADGGLVEAWRLRDGRVGEQHEQQHLPERVQAVLLVESALDLEAKIKSKQGVKGYAPDTVVECVKSCKVK